MCGRESLQPVHARGIQSVCGDHRQAGKRFVGDPDRPARLSCAGCPPVQLTDPLSPPSRFVIDTNFGLSADPSLVASPAIKAVGEAGLWPFVDAIEIGNEMDIYASHANVGLSSMPTLCPPSLSDVLVIAQSAHSQHSHSTVAALWPTIC